MKKLYEAPIAELIYLDAAHVILTSENENETEEICVAGDECQEHTCNPVDECQSNQ